MCVPVMKFVHCLVECTMHQCSECGYTSPVKLNVTRHILSFCPGASCVSQKCTFRTDGGGGDGAHVSGCGGGGVHVGGSFNTTTTTNTTNNTTNIVVVPQIVCVGSKEERDALYSIFQDPGNLRELANREPEEIPAALFRMWKGVDAPCELRNISVKGDKVQEIRGPDRVVSVPRTKFVKKVVGDMIHSVNNVPPETTPNPGRMKKVHEDLHDPRAFKCGKKRHVSRYEAMKMHTTGSKEQYDLDAHGRHYVESCKTLVDRELDFV